MKNPFLYHEILIFLMGHSTQVPVVWDRIMRGALVLVVFWRKQDAVPVFI